MILRATHLLVVAMLSAHAALAQSAPLLFCYEDKESYPWVMHEQSGLNVLLLQRVGREVGVNIEFVRYPWRRCLAALAAGTVDGAFAGSFTATRASIGRFPLLDNGLPDKTKRMHVSGYSLYRRKGDNVTWDGKNIQHLQGTIGVQSGFSIAEFLKQRGAVVDQGTNSPEHTLKKLLAGHIQAAALQTARADFLLRSNPAFAQSLERNPLPLTEQAYFLLLSFKFVDEQPVLAKGIWRAIERVRATPDYQRLEAGFVHP